MPTPGKRQAQGTGAPEESSSWAPAAPASGSPSSAASSAAAAPGRSSESSLSSRQKRPFASASRVESLAALPARRSSSIRRMSRPSARTASAEPSLEALSRTRISRLDAGRVGALDRLQAGEQVIAAVGVHDAVGERWRHGRTIIARMADSAAGRIRVQLVDPSAFTPPYDRALAAALARAGAEVELATSRFLYGPVPEAEGYRVEERFYRRSAGRGLEAPGRRAFKLAEHLPDMLRFRRDPGAADVRHYQWLTLPGLDALLLPPDRPRAMTAHYILPPRPSRRQVASARRAFGRHGRGRRPLRARGAAPARRGRARPRPGQGHPARRLRLPDEASRRGAAAGRARGGGGPGGPLLRPAPSL